MNYLFMAMFPQQEARKVNHFARQHSLLALVAIWTSTAP